MRKISFLLSFIILFSPITALAENRINTDNLTTDILYDNSLDIEDNSNTEIINKNIEEDENSKNTEDGENQKNTQNINNSQNIESIENNPSFNVNKKYEKSNFNISYFNSINNLDENGIEREYFENDKSGLSSLYTLKPITKSNFEIALALPDGEFSYIESADSFENAMDRINNEDLHKFKSSGLLSIINSNGQVVYSEESIGRIVKHINGTPDSSNSNISNIYTSSNLSTAHTYVNHGYIDDVPIIQNLETSAQVMVSGYKGWMNKNTNSNDFDLITIPLNHVKNPSHYIVKNGILNHFISSDILSSSLSGHYVKIGPAPNYLNENTKYYSYDGNFFYSSLSILINDLKNNNYSKAINSSNKYYPYYLNLPFRSKTVYTANDLNTFINNNTVSTSKLRNTGSDFINAQNKYGVNALLMLGVAINESGWGTSNIAMSKNNIFGMNAVDSTPGESANYYKTVADCINEFANHYISNRYANPKDWRYYGSHLGNKDLGANVKYASDPFWGEKASSHAFNIDFSLSNSQLNLLKDFDNYQLAIHTSNSNIVTDSALTLYQSKTNSPLIIKSNEPISVNGIDQYKITPDITSPVNSGDFNGSFSWDIYGFAPSHSIKFINKAKYIPAFTDISGHWGESVIELFAQKGFIGGYPDGSFKPNNSINRAEFIKLVNCVFNFTEEADENFIDVSPEYWYYGEVRKAVKAGYISIASNTFRPNDYISREEAAAIITNIKNNKDLNLDKLNEYLDSNQVSEWAKSSVEGAIEAKYMGKGSNLFRPLDFVTRAEAVALLSPLLN